MGVSMTASQTAQNVKTRLQIDQRIANIKALPGNIKSQGLVDAVHTLRENMSRNNKATLMPK